jgi:hypothetical protein
MMVFFFRKISLVAVWRMDWVNWDELGRLRNYIDLKERRAG